MSGSLIDTNVIIKLLNGDNKAAELFDSLNDIHISVITAGELYYGAQKSNRIDENTILFKSFLSEYSMVEINESVSEAYGQIKANLVKQGINILIFPKMISGLQLLQSVITWTWSPTMSILKR